MQTQCGVCRWFDGDADHIEQAFPGLGIFSSGRGSVRGSDGLCGRHGLYLPGNATCADHDPRPLISRPSDPM